MLSLTEISAARPAVKALNAKEKCMRTISYTALRNNLAHALESLEQGEVFCVTRRGREDLILKGEAILSPEGTTNPTPIRGEVSFRMEDLL